MITRIPVQEAGNRLQEIFAGLSPGDEALIIDAQSTVIGRFLPPTSDTSRESSVENPQRTEAWKKSLEWLSSQKIKTHGELNIDRGTFYE